MTTLLVGFLFSIVIVVLAVSLFPHSAETVSSTSLLEAFLEHALQQQQESQPQGGNGIALIGAIFIVLAISSLLGFPLVSFS